jgi:hypothetical protein
VTRGSKGVALSAKEFALLETFMRRPGEGKTVTARLAAISAQLRTTAPRRRSTTSGKKASAIRPAGKPAKPSTA